MKYFKNSGSFFQNKKKKSETKIKSIIDIEQQQEQESRVEDEIAARASYVHATNNPAGNPDFKRQ